MDPRATHERKQIFGVALREARQFHCGRFGIVTAELLADLIGVGTDAYYKYEQGERAFSRDQLTALLDFYAHDKATVKKLAEAYEASYGKKRKPQSLLQLVANARPHSFLEEIQRLNSESCKLYDQGKVAEAHELAQTAWRVSKKSNMSGAPTFSLALTLSRFESQVGRNREAITVLNRCAKLAIDEGEPSMSCSIELSLAACRLRANAARPTQAAKQYGQVAEMIRSRYRGKIAEMSPQWAWTWCDAHRSRVQCLTISLDDTDTQFIRYVWADFESEIAKFEWLGRTRDNTAARVRAAIGDPDTALSNIAELEGQVESFGDLAFHAMSRIIVFHRTGSTEKAISECDKWSDLCATKGMVHKRMNFVRIGDLLRRKAS